MVPDPSDTDKAVREIDDKLFHWLLAPDGRELPVPGIIIRCKAREIALRIGYRRFETTPIWFERFCRKYDVSQFYDPTTELVFKKWESWEKGQHWNTPEKQALLPTPNVPVEPNQPRRENDSKVMDKNMHDRQIKIDEKSSNDDNNNPRDLFESYDRSLYRSLEKDRSSHSPRDRGQDARDKEGAGIGEESRSRKSEIQAASKDDRIAEGRSSRERVRTPDKRSGHDDRDRFCRTPGRRRSPTRLSKDRRDYDRCDKRRDDFRLDDPRREESKREDSRREDTRRDDSRENSRRSRSRERYRSDKVRYRSDRVSIGEMTYLLTADIDQSNALIV